MKWMIPSYNVLVQWVCLLPRANADCRSICLSLQPATARLLATTWPYQCYGPGPLSCLVGYYTAYCSCRCTNAFVMLVYSLQLSGSWQRVSFLSLARQWILIAPHWPLLVYFLVSSGETSGLICDWLSFVVLSSLWVIPFSDLRCLTFYRLFKPLGFQLLYLSWHEPAIISQAPDISTLSLIGHFLPLSFVSLTAELIRRSFDRSGPSIVSLGVRRFQGSPWRRALARREIEDLLSSS